ncbi:hypothetical protein IscW_ISCW010420 [Ixodes scapularis]|uniref:Reverse transcriptase domain-containing protein n=1 Tax=Ixodes scapularis TaxID=6945 RepID=B7Q7E1_IXOSC|nr:hypothetical protein IscW_ISCW010420 [Ixodes scapularis]|eukprot:XP_002403932.1 hypothetical protein IscW_ISCW010420 [Ixodes scapularis]
MNLSFGIRQGCPLSGLLFNLVLDRVIRAVQGGEGQQKILAYADDVTPSANNPGTLQQRLNTVAVLVSQLGLWQNPAKCRTFHLSGQQLVGTRPTSFLIEHVLVPTIGDLIRHSFLDRPVRYRVLHDDATISDAVNPSKRLLGSVVAP